MHDIIPYLFDFLGRSGCSSPSTKELHDQGIEKTNRKEAGNGQLGKGSKERKACYQFRHYCLDI